METVWFLRDYARVFVSSWFGIVGVLLTVVEILRLFGVKVPPLSVRIARIAAVTLLFAAGAQAYKDLKDRNVKTPAGAGFAPENPDHANLGVENRRQADELATLRLQLSEQTSRVGKLETDKKALETEASALRQQLDDRRRRRQVRDNLSKFLDEGIQLNRIASDGNQTVPTDGISDWITRLEKYLGSVDASYVTRSRSGAGVSVGILQTDAPPTPARSRAVGAVRIRMARLEEFIREWSQ